MMPTIPAEILQDGLLSPPVISRGISDEARSLGRQSNEVVRHLWQSLSVRRVADTGFADLDRVRREASVDGWDGPGTRAVDLEALTVARQLVLVLPSTVVQPTISVDSDGEIDLAWDLARDRVFSISVSRSRRLTYAGLLGTERHAGTAHFDDEIPRTISALLAAYFPSGR